MNGDRWSGLNAKAFFERRILADVPALYYGHPKAWNEIGFGGPVPPLAAMSVSTATALTPGRRRKPSRDRNGPPRSGTGMSSDPNVQPRATRGRALDVFRKGGWVPMREYRDSEAVDFVIVVTGAGGGTLAALLAEQGFSVIAFDAGLFPPAGGFCRSDETAQNQLIGPISESSTVSNPIKMGGKNSGKAVGGSTVHYAMVALRFRPEWFKSRTTLGYGADWPISWEEMWHYYGIAERQINISGPLTYPWGPKRPRYPYRAHELNTAGKLLAKGCEAIGIDWTETPLATLSASMPARRETAPHAPYRGFLPVRLHDQHWKRSSALTV